MLSNYFEWKKLKPEENKFPNFSSNNLYTLFPFLEWHGISDRCSFSLPNILFVSQSLVHVCMVFLLPGTQAYWCSLSLQAQDEYPFFFKFHMDSSSGIRNLLWACSPLRVASLRIDRLPGQGSLSQPGTEPKFLRCRWILYHLSHQGSPLKIVIRPNLMIHFLGSFSS